jgi:hypothetical protein
MDLERAVLVIMFDENDLRSANQLVEQGGVHLVVTTGGQGGSRCIRSFARCARAALVLPSYCCTGFHSSVALAVLQLPEHEELRPQTRLGAITGAHDVRTADGRQVTLSYLSTRINVPHLLSQCLAFSSWPHSAVTCRHLHPSIRNKRTTSFPTAYPSAISRASSARFVLSAGALVRFLRHHKPKWDIVCLY